MFFFCINIRNEKSIKVFNSRHLFVQDEFVGKINRITMKNPTIIRKLLAEENASTTRTISRPSADKRQNFHSGYSKPRNRSGQKPPAEDKKETNFVGGKCIAPEKVQEDTVRFLMTHCNRLNNK